MKGVECVRLLVGAHLHEGNLEALAWERQVPERHAHTHTHTISLRTIRQGKRSFKDKKFPSHSFAMIGWLGCRTWDTW